MARELILMNDVDGLGSESTIVKVADGYARTFLIPRKLAEPISNPAQKRLEKKRLDREVREKKDIESAQALAETIEQTSCTISVKVGDNDKMFGSVTSKEIVEALSSQGIALDKHMLHIDEPIHELGVYTIKVKPHPQVEASLKIWVVGE